MKNGGLLMGEVAKQVGVNRETIRYYERVGLLPPPRRTRSGYRLYSPEMVDRVRFIKTAQSLGLSLREIRELIALSHTGRSPCGRVRTLLREKLQAVERKIAELQAFRRELAAQIAALDRLPDQADSSPQVCSLIMTIARHRGPKPKKGGMTDAIDTTDRAAASSERSGRNRNALRVQGHGESDELSRSDRLSAHGKDHLSRRLPAAKLRKRS
jgi:DNA-binding transcriptional MerR regulator